MLIGVPLETAAGETRVSVTPETAKKLKAQGHTIRVQSGAGVAASVGDASARVGTAAGITVGTAAFPAQAASKSMICMHNRYLSAVCILARCSFMHVPARNLTTGRVLGVRQGLAFAIRQPHTARDLVAQDAVLRHQVLVAQEEFLVD